jgi:hypothetical protein
MYSPDEKVYQGMIVDAKTQQNVCSIIVICPDILSGDEDKVFDKVKNPLQIWDPSIRRLVRDLQHPNRMWMVDSFGRMTHYINWGSPACTGNTGFQPGTCPTCGDRGTFIRMALTCPTHGVFGGC